MNIAGRLAGFVVVAAEESAADGVAEFSAATPRRDRS